jgi:hypothetical protein
LGGPLAGYVTDNFRPVVPLSAAALMSIVPYGLMSVTLRYNLVGWLWAFPIYYVMIGLASCMAYNCALTTIVKCARLGHRGWMTTLGSAFFAFSSFWMSKWKALMFPTADTLENFFMVLGWLLTGVFLLFGVTAWICDIPDLQFGQDEMEQQTSVVDTEAGRDDEESEGHSRPVSVTSSPLPEDTAPYGMRLFKNKFFLFLGLIFAVNVALSITYVYKHPEMFQVLMPPQPSSNVTTKLKLHDIPHQVTDYHALVISAGNFASRLLVGAMSDWSLSTFGLPRFTFVVVASALCMSGWGALFCFSMLTTKPHSVDQLYSPPVVAASLLISLCYGTTFAITPCIIAEWFGTLHFGANWGWMGVFPTISHQSYTLLFASLLQWSKDQLLSSQDVIIVPKGLKTALITSFSIQGVLTLFLTVWLIKQLRKDGGLMLRMILKR